MSSSVGCGFFYPNAKIFNPKHREIIDKVIKDLVGIFGHNFKLTMEKVFTTYEITKKIITLTRRISQNLIIV
jgi:hypothetical protein